MDLNGVYQVEIIPKVGTAFEDMPKMPRLDIFPKLITSAIMVSFICYTSTWSLQKMFAKEHGYEVHPNQELIAMGLANVGSSFFLCFPCAGSLARSAVQNKVGGRTQLASLISSVLVIIFILFLTPLLATLPNVSYSLPKKYQNSYMLLSQLVRLVGHHHCSALLHICESHRFVDVLENVQTRRCTLGRILSPSGLCWHRQWTTLLNWSWTRTVAAQVGYVSVIFQWRVIRCH